MRHPYGPRPVSALLPHITRPVFRRRAPATAQLLLDWEAIVGPALAAVTLPRRLSAGTLTIACTGPVALELQHLASEVISRLNVHLGSAVIARLRLVQDVPPTNVPPPRRLRRPAVEQADRAVDTLPAGPLRDALAALGRVVLADTHAIAGLAEPHDDASLQQPSTARPIKR